MCHNRCLDEPVDYIPEEDFYCRDCCLKFDLKNVFLPPVPFNTDLYAAIRAEVDARDSGLRRQTRQRRLQSPLSNTSDEDLRERITDGSLDSTDRQDKSNKEDGKRRREQRLEARRRRIIDERKQRNRKYKPSPIKKNYRRSSRHRLDCQITLFD